MTGVLKVAIALVLFVCFSYYFGYPSIVKYLACKTAIGRSKKNVPFVPSPAITLLPHWKTMDFDTDNCTDTLDTAMEVFECLRNDSFSFRDIVVEESTHRKYCWHFFTNFGVLWINATLNAYIDWWNAIYWCQQYILVPTKMLLGIGEVTSQIQTQAFHLLEMTSSTCPQTMENPTLSSWTVTILRPLLSYMIRIFSSPAPTLQLSLNMSNKETTTVPFITRSTLRLQRSCCSTYQTILVKNPWHTATTSVLGTMLIRYDERWLLALGKNT